MARNKSNKRRCVESDSDNDDTSTPTPSQAPSTDDQRPNPAAAPAAMSSKQKALDAFNRRWKTAERSPQEVLGTPCRTVTIMAPADGLIDAQQEKWFSDVYNNFHAPEIVEVDGGIKYKFVCRKE